MKVYHYKVTKIQPNQYMGTEYHDHNEIFCCGKIRAEIGDKVEMYYEEVAGQPQFDELRFIKVNGVIQWRKEVEGLKGDEEMAAFVKRRQKELSARSERGENEI